MSETPRSDEERTGNVQPTDPLRSTEDEREDDELAAQGESEDEKTEIDDEETDEDEGTRE
jgi:hypothetical protein